MKKLMMIVMLYLLGSFGSIAMAEPPPNYPFHTYDEGLRLAQAQNKPLFVYFGRLGCAWCDKTNRESFSNELLRKNYIEHYILVYVDSESGKRLSLPSGERITEAELGARFKAFATPMFVYLDSQGKEIVKIPGFKTVADFQDYDHYVSEGYYKRMTLLQFLGEK